MADKTLTDYERRRIDNIRRNGEMMASLMLHQKASSLLYSRRSPSPKPQSKKPKLSSSPVAIRRSLRTQGLPPSSSTPPSDDSPSSPSSSDQPPSTPPWKQGPLRISDALVGDSPLSDRDLMDVIKSGSVASEVDDLGFDPMVEMCLKPENVARVLPERILSVRFLPFGDQVVVTVGDKAGNVGFWDVGKGRDGVYVYKPHASPVSGISVHPFAATKIFTSSYDGFIRLMDVEEETFNMIYASDFEIFSISQVPNDHNSLYCGEGTGILKAWDERAGKVSGSWELHEDRINTIDFNPQNTNSIATSSTDRTACIWDVRSINKDSPESLKKVQHLRAVHSAFFSPSGSCLATTSIDDKVIILSGSDFDDLSMILHNNQTGRWLSSFRAIWGWDDSFLFIGNMRRAVDVISTSNKTTISLESEHMTSIPCRFSAHPCLKGTMACATAGGKVNIWTKISR
ncbi:WD repeat-containing protein 76 [Dioscorea cayenensis subsp. rotundata]|uniref:WD repeat-containing protein 76 n=1 Tax=Dioscorea cayennensis subsp. rotundata TaxID=55577 RepID=A0AB40CNR9_DIOCR|nr:WD repeat-containing protein 76 [Dioscorea cayenensis subsp. rotundata]